MSHKSHNHALLSSTAFKSTQLHELPKGLKKPIGQKGRSSTNTDLLTDQWDDDLKAKKDEIDNLIVLTNIAKVERQKPKLPGQLKFTCAF